MIGERTISWKTINQLEINWKRNGRGAGLKSFKEVYDETKTRVACYMAAATNKWIKAAWRNESWIEQISLKKEVENEGSVITGKESYTEWKEKMVKSEKDLKWRTKKE